MSTLAQAQADLLYGFPVDRELEAQLVDFDPATRRAALDALCARSPHPRDPAAIANLHCHTFFSYNAYGLSPTALAWLARQRGIPLMGIVDFDTLDGVDEFLEACDRAQVRGTAGIETRVFVPEFADLEINSPGEPGVLYHMGVGLAHSTPGPAPEQIDSAAQTILGDLGEQSAQRNRALLARINAYLAPVVVDYDAAVLPRTPNGNATERHIVAAYIDAAAQHFPAVDELASFWAARLALAPEAARALLGDLPGLQNRVRAKLMKQGGVGYVQPDHDTFPSLERFHVLVRACGALPCAAWLDGSSPGEQRMSELLELLMAQGVVALNIIPDRNWDYADSTVQERKVSALYAVVELAQTHNLPIIVGTEMNSFGQKLIDDFDAAPMRPLRQTFLDGAYFLYGHTALQRHVGLGYQSEWAQDQLPDRAARNRFYTQVGRGLPPGEAGRHIVERVRQLTARESVHELAPEQVVHALAL